MKDANRKAMMAKKKFAKFEINKFGDPVDSRYDIVRFYHPSQNKRRRVIKRNVSGDVAHSHVNDPKTSVKNKHFDGFEKR